MQEMPARCAYAAAEAEVFPVDAHATAWAPASTAFDTAIVIPRSLNEPVGLVPSYLRYTLRWTASDSRCGVDERRITLEQCHDGRIRSHRQPIAERLDQAPPTHRAACSFTHHRLSTVAQGFDVWRCRTASR